MSGFGTVTVAGVDLCVVWPGSRASFDTIPEDAQRKSAGKRAKNEDGSPNWGHPVSSGRPEALRGCSLPVVFLLHGRKGKKQKLDEIANLFASCGLLCVYGDAPNHGERAVESARNLSWGEGNQTHAVDMYAQLLASLKELQLQLDILPTILGVEFSKVAVFGISQGGHASLICTAHEPRIDVCVSLISSGDYLLNMEKRYEGMKNGLKDPETMSSCLPSFEELLPLSLRHTIGKFDPINNCEKFVGKRSVLIINGGADELVPLECNQKFFKAVQDVLSQSSSNETTIKHVILDGVGHRVTPEMLDQSKEWLKAHL